MPPRKKKAATGKKRKATVLDGAGPSAQPEPEPPASNGNRPAEGEPTADPEELAAQERREKALTMALVALQESAAEVEDVEAWVEEACVWLAADAECHEETSKMRVAMQESLYEAEERKALEKPLIEMSGKELFERFPESELLAVLREGLGEAGVCELIDTAQGNLMSKLCEYLQMEQRCKRWYSCSKAYFEEAAQQGLKANALGEKDSEERLDGGALVDAGARAEAEIEKAEDPAPSGGVSGNKPLETSSGEKNGHDSVVVSSLLSFLEEQLSRLVEAVYSTRNTVPSIFTAFAEEEVVILDDD